MTELRVSIIGAGQAGERHAVGFAATAGAKLVGIADVMEARATKLASRFDAKAFTDWREMLSAGLDILVVSLPHNMHVEPALAAAERGVHVLMEKPLATTLEDAKKIVEACKSANVKLTISFVHRFREELQLARRWLDEGQLGRPQILRETMNGQRGHHLPKWVTQKKVAGGGVLMYSAIHGLDRLRWLAGSEVVSVTAQTRHYSTDSEVEDGVVALLNFASGATATLCANAPVYRAQPAHWDTEIYGDKGMLRLRTRQWAELSNDHCSEHVDTEKISSEQGPHYNFARQAKEFITAIREDREPFITGGDGLKSLELALAIYRSAETGQSVSLKGA
jgi:predicted dehydrogenase